MAARANGSQIRNPDRTKNQATPASRLWKRRCSGVPGETWAGAAVREVAEETGYRVAVERLAGLYRKPRRLGGGTVYVCLGRVTGGAPIPAGPETRALRWLAPAQARARLLRFDRLAL